jgi:queuine tRNA-ribosyltransferase subunit QTRTD1
MAIDTSDRTTEPSGLSFEIFSSTDHTTRTARLGRVRIAGRKDVETPNFFSISSRGVVPHLAPDIISAHTQFAGVHMALEDCKFVTNHVK